MNKSRSLWPIAFAITVTIIAIQEPRQGLAQAVLDDANAPLEAGGGGGATTSFAFCDDVADPSTCYPMQPNYLYTADPDDSPAFCKFDPLPHATSCRPLEIQCCQHSADLVWLDACWEHGPGDECQGTVTATEL